MFELLLLDLRVKKIKGQIVEGSFLRVFVCLFVLSTIHQQVDSIKKKPRQCLVLGELLPSVFQCSFLRDHSNP